jgi:hypothetical protein
MEMTGSDIKKLNDSDDNLNDEAIKNIAALQDVLKRVHVRLISEGYIIKNGSIVKPTLGKKP